MNSRQQRREVNRELAKEAGGVIVSHEQRLFKIESALSVVIQILKDDGLITDEKWQMAQEKIVESIQKVQEVRGDDK